MKAEKRYIEVLIEGISLNDDYKSFEVLFNLFYNKLYSFSCHYVKIPEAAEEIVSDVFLKIWIKRKDLPEIQNIESYLYTATKNQSLNYINQKGNKPLHSINDHSHSLSSNTPTPEETMMHTELAANISQAVNALPAQCKLIYKLIREDGLSYKEASSVLGISVKTIEVQIGIALKKIYAALKGYQVRRKKSKISE